MWVVILRFQSRDSSMSFCSLKWWEDWRSSESSGEIFIAFPYQILHSRCFRRFTVFKLSDTLSGIQFQRYFTVKCKSIPLELTPVFLLPFYKFPEAHDLFPTPLFLSHLTSKLPTNPLSFRMKIYPESYHFCPSSWLSWPSWSKPQSSLTCIFVTASNVSLPASFFDILQSLHRMERVIPFT